MNLHKWMESPKLFNNFNIISIQKLQDINLNNQQDLDEIIKVVGSVRNVIQVYSGV